MSSSPRCYYPLFRSGRLAGDLAELARGVPRGIVERKMNLRLVDAVQGAAGCPIRWSGVFAKGFAKVAARQAELRRIHVSFPVPRLYEHPVNIAAVWVERSGQEIPVFLAEPESRGLAELDHVLENAERGTADAEWSRLNRMPGPVRRLVWRTVAGWGPLSATWLGTFAVSSVADRGGSEVISLHPQPIAITFGPLEADGGMTVRLGYDVRILGRAGAAGALEELEMVLQGEIVNELRYLESLAA